MIAESFRGWDLSKVESIQVVYLRQHEETYGVHKMLQKQFEKLGLSERLHLVMIEKKRFSAPHGFPGFDFQRYTGAISDQGC